MDLGTKLEELKLTEDEVNRFSKALKDEQFRELLREYSEEISKPENKKRYEEEIAQLEQERGAEVRFIHPTAHHVLESRAQGQERCFINICSNDLINKPTCEPGRGPDGAVGEHWALPYSLTPGRADIDAPGGKCMIYDVVFHPDTLDRAGKSPGFLELVNSTALQVVEEAFHLKLDKTNRKELGIQYKGVPRPAVIRSPAPGLSGTEKASPKEGHCPIPYPTGESATACATEPSPIRDRSSEPPQPTKPQHSVKYRSTVDLQDYRCSRDSAPSPRPKEIVISIDLPLIRSAADIDLNVTQRRLVLESQKPAYKLELDLSYPVDDNRGDAKFDKTKKQLTVTVPVLPADEPAVFPDGVNKLGGQEQQRGEKECEDKPEDLGGEAPGQTCLFDESKAAEALLASVGADIVTRRAETEGGFLRGADHCTSETASKYHTKPETDRYCSREEGPVFQEAPHSNVESTALSTQTPAAAPVSVGVCRPSSPSEEETTKTGESGMILAQKAVNCSPENTSPQLKHKDMCPPLIEDTNVPQGDSGVRSSEQSQTDITMKIDIIREDSPKEEREVITDQITAAALSFENSLWLELD